MNFLANKILGKNFFMQKSCLVFNPLKFSTEISWVPTQSRDYTIHKTRMLPTRNTYAAKKTVRQIYNYKAQTWKTPTRRKKIYRIDGINHKEQEPMADKQNCLRICHSTLWLLAGKFGRIFFFSLELSSVKHTLSILYCVWHLSKTGTFHINPPT